MWLLNPHHVDPSLTIMNWSVPHFPKSYIEALTPMTVFGGKALRKVIEVNWGHKGGP